MNDERLSLVWQGLERRALLHAPGRPGPLPLVIALHGTGGSPRLMASISGLSKLADARNFLVAYPQALGKTGSEDPVLGAAWNSGPGLGCPAFADADDVGFLRELVKEIARRHPVDPARVHLCGISNGGRMAYRMALEAPELASIAVVSGAWSGGAAKPARSVSTLIFHGTADDYIPYGGGPGSKGRRVAHAPAPESAYRWAQLMGCSGKPLRSFDGACYCDAMGSRDGRTEVAFWTLPEGGHAWPGGKAWSPTSDQPSQELSASKLIWDFFARHPMA